MTIQSNRTLGGVGALLSVVGVVTQVVFLVELVNASSLTANAVLSLISNAVGVFAFIGLILFLVAMHGFSKDYGDHRIFDYPLYGLIISIVGFIVAFAFLFILAFGSLFRSFSATSPTQIEASILPILAPFIIVVVAIALVNVLLNVGAFNLLGDKANVPLFRVSAKVLLAGALLSVVLGIIFAVLAASAVISSFTLIVILVPGGIVQDAAWVLLAMSYFRIKPPQTMAFQQPNPVPPPSVMPPLTIVYCPNCGYPNRADSTFCERCGQKLPQR